MENRVLLDVLSVCEDFWKMLSGQREQSALLFVSFFLLLLFSFHFFFLIFFFFCVNYLVSMCVLEIMEREREIQRVDITYYFLSSFFFFLSLGLWIDCLYYSPLSFILH